MITYTLLANRSIIKIEGDDRFKFLQGLITNDINKITPSHPLYACMLTPQGRYYTDLFICSEENSFLLEVPAARRDEIINKLNIYKLRSAVTLSIAPQYNVLHFSSVQEADFSDSIIFQDPRSDKMGFRAFVHENKMNEITENMLRDDNAYDLLRINNFIAEGEKDLVVGKAFLLEYGFENLNAIDYKKGCYIGQELVARTHYIGEVRKEIAKVEGVSDTTEFGAEVYSNGKKVGIILSKINDKALALVRGEDIRSLEPEAEFLVNGKKIKLTLNEE